MRTIEFSHSVVSLLDVLEGFVIIEGALRTKYIRQQLIQKHGYPPICNELASSTYIKSFFIKKEY